jgi:hypothetical protein
MMKSIALGISGCMTLEREIPQQRLGESVSAKLNPSVAVLIW